MSDNRKKSKNRHDMEIMYNYLIHFKIHEMSIGENVLVGNLGNERLNSMQACKIHCKLFDSEIDHYKDDSYTSST